MNLLMDAVLGGYLFARLPAMIALLLLVAVALSYPSQIKRFNADDFLATNFNCWV